jgi:hypothetical protein
MSREQDVATFDSATGSADALAAFLRGEEWAAGGAVPRTLARLLHPLASLIARAPRGWLEAGYGRSGWLEAIEADEAGEVSGEAAARRLIGGYPERQYPVALVGAPNGAASHLAALLGAPWLSQTFLVLVRHGGIDVDEPRRIMEWAQAGPARALLEANPDLVLHQMHDPNNDRLMARHTGYFRVKRTRLGAEYERFLEERVVPGGTLVTVECTQRWPATRAGDRHWFQFGGMGAVRWREIVSRASQVGRVLDLDLERFPRDVSTYLGFQEALREIPSRYPIPPPIPITEVDAFFAESAGRYPVEWLTGG